MRIEPDLARAYASLRRGDLGAAEEICRNVLARAADHPHALHLLSLARKEAGDLAESERLMRRSIELEPGHADFRANLGNLLRRLGRMAEAEPMYRKALSLDPNHHAARLGLARTLNDLGRALEAEGESRVLIAARGNDPQSWSALAMALRDQGRLHDAEQAYHQAMALAPDDSRAPYNLAVLLLKMDRSEEALGMLERARALGLTGFAPAFTRGRALVQLYRFEEAERAYAEAVALAPTNLEAQLNLTKLRFMLGDPQFARDLVAAASRHRDDSRLQLLLADVLRRIGDLQSAELLLRDLMTRLGGLPQIRSSLATVLQESGRLREAENEALQAAAALPQDSAIIANLVAILLGLGRAHEALPFIRTERRRTPLDQSWIAYEATALRLLGDPAYGALCDYDRLVRIYDLAPPEGWNSIDAFNAQLVAVLAPRHRFVNHPFDQSLRHGTQTAHNLVTDPDPAIQAAFRMFGAAITDYQTQLGCDPGHVMSARNHGPAHFVGAWSIQLRRNGFHVNHVHPEGWLSSVYYVSVPREVEDMRRRSGWLKFGEPRFPVPGAPPERVVQPRAGRLVLFPSYLWHGTTPIHGDEPRLTIAFDAVPTGRPATLPSP